MSKNLYFYKAELVRVIDGDTVELLIDVGFHVLMKHSVRFYGVDTPELRSKNLKEKLDAIAARDYVNYKLCNAEELYIKTFKDEDKFGRYLGEIFYKKNNAKRRTSINKELIRLKFGRKYFGGTKIKWWR